MAKFLFYDDMLINILLQDEEPSGGAAVQAYGWIRGLLKSGQEVYILTHSDKNRRLKEECKDLNLVSLYNEQKGIRWVRWLYYRIPYIYSKLKQIKPDYLYLSIPGWGSLVMGLICHQLGVKYIQRISSDIQVENTSSNLNPNSSRFFLNLGLRLTHSILCQNDYQLSLIRLSFPYKRAIKLLNPIYVAPCASLEKPLERQYIAWLGLYRYPKNLKLLFEIASILKDQQFMIAGKEIPKIDEETVHYLNRLKELPNVKFIGFLHRQQVLPFLAGAKFLLNTSRYEGFSNTFLESMAVGTPIISTHRVNPDEIISKYKLGIVYNDAQDLHQQYKSLTPDVYHGLSSNTREYVRQHHDYIKQAEKLLTFLND